MTNTTLAVPGRAATERRIVIGALAAAMIVAIGINTLIALTAFALGAHHSFGPLAIQEYGGGTVVGIVVGWLGWQRLLPRLGRHRMLTVLVPAVGLALFIPDLLLLGLRFIPETTAIGVFALMAMHIVVIATAVPTYLAASRQ